MKHPAHRVIAMNTLLIRITVLAGVIVLTSACGATYTQLNTPAKPEKKALPSSDCPYGTDYLTGKCKPVPKSVNDAVWWQNTR
jgi:hypothetical protein